MDNADHYGFALPDELIMLRDQVRRFMREEVKPIEDRLPHDATGCAPEDRARLRAKAEAMGMTRLTVPEEYGGNQVSALARAIVAEESAKCRLGAYAPALGAFAGGPPVVIWGGTPEQIAEQVAEYHAAGLRHVVLWNITPFGAPELAGWSFKALAEVKDILRSRP